MLDYFYEMKKKYSKCGTIECITLNEYDGEYLLTIYEADGNSFVVICNTDAEVVNFCNLCNIRIDYANVKNWRPIYLEIRHKDGDWFTYAAYPNREIAIEAARLTWSKLTSAEKKTHNVLLLVYEQNILMEDCNCFDANTIEWK